MRQISDFIAFIKKNKTIIYVLLGTAILLQICSKGSQTVVDQPLQEIESVIPLENTTPISPIPQEQLQQPKTQNDFSTLLFMVIMVLLFFVAKRFGWLQKLFPKIVILRSVFYKRRSSGDLALKLYIINHTKRDITFDAPSLQFFKGNKKREFAIKNIGGKNYFPLTLFPGTGHKLTIDAQKFYNQVDGLKQFKTIRVIVRSSAGKNYSTAKWPVWLTFRKM
jgi:hypothetical protein